MKEQSIVRCDYCKKDYFQETSWLNLFSRKQRCNKCSSLLEQEIMVSRIPIDDGFVDIYSLFKENEIPVENEINYYNKYSESLKIAITNDCKYEIILYFDDELFETIDNWSNLIFAFKRICFMQFKERDLSIYMRLF